MRLPFRRREKSPKEGKMAMGVNPPEYGLCPRPDGLILKSTPTYLSSQLLAALPATVMQRIFSYVAPHTQDESYETCENSSIDSGCSLCDLRDLSNCTKVSKAWRPNALKVL